MTDNLTRLFKIVLDKGIKQERKINEKKTTKLKYKEGEDDLGGWTEVKGSSLYHLRYVALHQLMMLIALI